MRRTLLTLILTAILFQTGLAGDLYKVNLHSSAEADALKAMNVEPLVWVAGGYLVLADNASSEQLINSGLDAQLLASNVSKDLLALDGHMDRRNAKRFEVLYEAEGIRLLMVPRDKSLLAGDSDGLFPILNEHLTIDYRESVDLDDKLLKVYSTTDIIADLVNEVNTDSLYNYVCSLQAYPYRVPGSVENSGARNWIFNKFLEFGYTDVELDPFPYYFVDCNNVVAYKTGTLYPDRQLVIGGHYDAVLNSPGADDNGSGTAAVLEIARVLKDVESPITIVFVAFDAEEVGLEGAEHFAETAVANGDDIVFMLNMDMIGAENNTTSARVYYGAEMAYAILWDHLAQTYVGMTTVYSGSSSRSDHYPFQQAGFDVVFSQEYNFSTVYHTALDNTSHMDFNYMTKVVQGNVATAYYVSQYPRGVPVVAVRQVGDGQSLEVNWIPHEWPNLVQHRIGYYESANPDVVNCETALPTDTHFVVSGLTEGVEYRFFVQAVDSENRESLPYFHQGAGTPLAMPQPPVGLIAMPLRNAIDLVWDGNNIELDFDHYIITRDGEVITQTDDIGYTDNDPSLGSDFHLYRVIAVDTDDNESDTLSSDPLSMRAATLDPDRILAINRSHSHAVDFVSAFETGEFLHEALQGYNYDFYSDTTATTNPFAMPQLDLVDMIDHGTLVIGAESGRYDDIGINPDWNGILDTLAYYMSIGGRIVMFGRWGEITVTDTVDYGTNSYHFDNSYKTSFHINYRVLTHCERITSHIESDLIGADGVAEGYPDLAWDSLVTMLHATAGDLPVTSVSGIPCESFVELTGGGAQPIYAYDSRDNNPNNEGKTVAWKYTCPDYGYVWFDIPLSHFHRASAVAALHQALEDVADITTDMADIDDDNLPRSFALRQNYPNPFNPHTKINYDLPRAGHVNLTVYNLLGQKVRGLVNSYQTAGHKSVTWDGRGDSGESVASGLYFYRLQSGDVAETKKMLLIK